jgi:transposase-like protein
MDTSPKSDIDEHGTERSTRRVRTPAERRAILREAAQPGASIAVVARKHGMNANLLFTALRTMTWSSLYLSDSRTDPGPTPSLLRSSAGTQI